MIVFRLPQNALTMAKSRVYSVVSHRTNFIAFLYLVSMLSPCLIKPHPICLNLQVKYSAQLGSMPNRLPVSL